ncbi:hypothetical protein BDW22DRAFT_1352599 [Trametopsis cervina]|nr:hypothetical protein BDW22DRAFT_1352599 [Trametopsis cervina]
MPRPRLLTILLLTLTLTLSTTTLRAQTCGQSCFEGDTCSGGCTCNFYDELCLPEGCIDLYHCSKQ